VPRPPPLILQPRVGLSGSRLETLCLLVVGIVSARTGNLERFGFDLVWNRRRTEPEAAIIAWLVLSRPTQTIGVL